MFTGLVETTARVRSLTHKGPMAVLALREFAVEPRALQLGESIAVSGVCLTVAAVHAGGFDADVSSETLALTTLGELAIGNHVNIERSLRVGDRMGGHMVLGHIDGVGRIAVVETVGKAWRVEVEAPEELARFFASKGSVTVDGCSLTVNRITGNTFELMLVPHTLSVTILGAWKTGTRVNLEVDVLARYVARQLGLHAASRDDSLWSKLKEAGYTS